VAHLCLATPWAICSPYNYLGGGVGEIALMLWLLIMGVNSERWIEQARVAK
jgi:hypothetical protein